MPRELRLKLCLDLTDHLKSFHSCHLEQELSAKMSDSESLMLGGGKKRGRPRLSDEEKRKRERKKRRNKAYYERTRQLKTSGEIEAHNKKRAATRAGQSVSEREKTRLQGREQRQRSRARQTQDQRKSNNVKSMGGMRRLRAQAKLLQKSRQASFEHVC